MKNLGFTAKFLFVLVFALMTVSIVSAYGTNNPIVFGHSAGELDFTGFAGNFSTSGSLIAGQVCIGLDCRTSWPTFSSTIINSTVIINNASTLNLTTFSSNNFIINGTVFLNGTLVLNNTSGTVVVLNNTLFQISNFTINNSFIINNTFTNTNNFVTNNTFVINNTVFTPNPINLNNIIGNVVASGDVQGNRVCIGLDCRTSWPTGSGSNVDIVHTTVGEINLVSQKSTSNHGVAQWMITGGHRFCVSEGYKTGIVVEYESDSLNSQAQVSCFD